jgi:dienelactone hydrolase
MLSIDKFLTRSARAAKSSLAFRWRQWCERFGPPAEHSALSSLHYILTEYHEPLPACPVQPYKMLAGQRGVGKRVLKIDGDLIKGPIKVTLTFPEGEDGPFPTVVLSPGLGAHPNANRYLEDHLASHGYLVVRPTHRGSNWFGVATRTPLGAFTRSEFLVRIKEMETVLFALESGELGFLGKPGQVALAGHSYGALTCCVLAGLPAEGISLEREYDVPALIALSPYGDSFPTRRLGIDTKGFEKLPQPVLFMSGTRDDMFTLGKGSKTHLEPFKLSGSQDKRHVMVGKTRHGSFSEIFGWVKRETKVMVNSSVTAFLDTHLLAQSESRDYLANKLPLAAFEYNSWAF